MRGGVRVLIGIGVLAALAIAAYLLPVASWALAFVRWAQSAGFEGALVYALVYMVGTVLLLPGTVLTIGAGFIYGPLGGVLISSPASVLGATISYLLGQTVLRGWIEQKLKSYPRFRLIDAAVARHGFKIVLLMRLEPIFIPFAMLNYGLGLTRVRLREYVLASFLGMLPATILYVYLGSVLQDLAVVAHGHLPHTGWAGRILLWAGVPVGILLFWVLGRIAHRALTQELAPDDAPQGAGA